MNAFHLRARSPGEILDAAFQFMRAEYGALLLGTGIVLLPPLVLRVIFPAGEPFWNLLANILYVAASAVPVVIVTDVYTGHPVDLGSALRRVGQRFLSIWMASFVFGIVVGFGLLLLVVPGVIAFSRLFAMPSIVMAEGETGTASFERSRDLTRGYTLHILKTLGVSYLIFWLASLGLWMAAGAAAVPLGLDETGIGFLIETFTIFLYPFVGVVSALLYIDLRVRKEALDVELLARALETPEEAAVTA